MTRSLEIAQRPVRIDWQDFWKKQSPSRDSNRASTDRMPLLYHLRLHHCLHLLNLETNVLLFFFQLRAISFNRSSSRKFRAEAEAGIDRSASAPTSKASDPTRPRRRRRRQRRSSSRRMSPNWPSARKLKLKVVRKKFPKFSKEVVRGRKKFSLQPQVQTWVGQNKSWNSITQFPKSPS